MTLLSPQNRCRLTSIEKNATPLPTRQQIKIFIDDSSRYRLLLIGDGKPIAAILLEKEHYKARIYYVKHYEGSLQDIKKLVDFASDYLGKGKVRME